MPSNPASSPPETQSIDSGKGKLGGRCNRQACLAPGATWWNVVTRAFYCRPCAAMINRLNRDYQAEHGHPICQPDKPAE